ncbi:MAG: type II toxin-antitoxin system HicB family antitoxin [Proteobacteria bacterium]|nr:type II toxin-antitoxin system HicB family antitoxin [Pseudomonadota bacterium]MCL2307231.1 type II toxin-antitoxin system HicB family antitoxin [Pseudomonadota bacterium]
MRYPVMIEKDGDGWLAKFPDIPEALAGGDTYEEALSEAAGTLPVAMEFYFEDRRPVPAPSKAKAGQATVELPPSVAAKVLLLNEMLRQNVTNADLARRVGMTRQEVQRIVDLGHSTKIDMIGKALAALGKHLDFKLTAA